MATHYWIGAAPKVAGVTTLTPATVDIGDTFTVTFANGRAFTFTATAATVANVTAGIVALLQASEDPLVAELTYEDSTTHVTVTGVEGKSFFISSSSVGGTFNASATTAATGPNNWDNVENWDSGAIPSAGDTAIIDNTDVSILYGIDNGSTLLTTALAELRIGAGFTGDIGLPEQDGAGYLNTGYRPTYLEAAATLVNIGQGVGNGSGRLKINSHSVATTVTVYSTGQPAENGVESVLWVGTHASNVVNVLSGSVGVCTVPSISASSPNTAATVATMRVSETSTGQPPTFRIGQGTSLTTLVQEGGTGICNVGGTTLTKLGGTLTLIGTGAWTTITNFGDLFDQSSGAITTLNNPGRYMREDARTKTIGTTNLYFGSELIDRSRGVTWTTLNFNKCRTTDLKLDIGTATLTAA